MSIHVRETAKGRRYDVKFRSADGRQHAKTFATKRAAVDYQARQSAAISDGVFVAPRASATRLAELAEKWLASGAKRDSTRSRDRSVILNHVLPGLGADRAVGRISRADCQALIDSWSRAGQAPRTVTRQAAALRAMFQYGVDADMIVRNPASRLRLPGASVVVRPQLTPEQLEALADALGGGQATFMWCGAVLGLRWAEVAGLSAASIDPAAGVVRVTNQVDRDGRLQPPKTRASIRSLAAPRWLIDELATAADTSTGDSGLLFTGRDGQPLSYPNWRQRTWIPATEAAGLAGLRFHDLRALAATALVASGVDLRTAMHRLGHTTPTMTLAVYARVAEDKDHAAADATAARIAPGRR